MSALIDKVASMSVHDGECWRWIGGFQASGTTPAMRWNNTVNSVRRFILLDKGAQIRSKLAGVSCGNLWCVNPDHVITTTRAKTSRIAAANMDAGARLARARATAEGRRKRAKLSIEQAREIRQDDRSQRTIAADYGVDQYTIWAIKNDLMYREYAANPFSGLFR